MQNYKIRIETARPPITYDEMKAASGISRSVCWKFVNDPAYIPQEGVRARFEAALSLLEEEHRKANNARIDKLQEDLEKERT